MMRTSTTLGIAALILAGLAARPAPSCERGSAPPRFAVPGAVPGSGVPGGPGPLRRLLDQLDLGDEQASHIDRLLEAQRRAVEPTMKALGEARVRLQAAIRSATFDESVVRAAAAEVSRFEADLAVSRARVLAEVRKVLTAEQAAGLDRLHERSALRMQELRERWHERPPARPAEAL